MLITRRLWGQVRPDGRVMRWPRWAAVGWSRTSETKSWTLDVDTTRRSCWVWRRNGWLTEFYERGVSKSRWRPKNAIWSTFDEAMGSSTNNKFGWIKVIIKKELCHIIASMSEIFRRMSSFVRLGFIWVFTFNFSVYEMLSFPRNISTCIIIHLKINNYAVSNAPEVSNASFLLKNTKRRLLS